MKIDKETQKRLTYIRLMYEWSKIDTIEGNKWVYWFAYMLGYVDMTDLVQLINAIDDRFTTDEINPAMFEAWRKDQENDY